VTLPNNSVTDGRAVMRTAAGSHLTQVSGPSTAGLSDGARLPTAADLQVGCSAWWVKDNQDA